MKTMRKLAAGMLACLLLTGCGRTAAPVDDPVVTTTTATTASATAATTTETTVPTATDTGTQPAPTTTTAAAVTATATTAANTSAATTAATTTRVTATTTSVTTTTTTTTTTAPPPPAPVAQDLLGVAAWDTDFLAVGTGGTVAVLDVSGTLTLLSSPVTATLRAVATSDGVALIVGDGGALLTFDGNAFCSVPGADTDLLSITAFGGVYYIGGAGGTLFTFNGDTLQPQPLPLLGNVVGLAADDRILIGVTDRGEVFSLTPEGTRRIYSANDDRSGDERIAFTAIAGENGLFWATARTAGGQDVVLTTLYGGVWSERALNVMEGDPFDPSGLRLGGLTVAGEQAIVAANDGRLLILPDCVQCNKLQPVGTGDFTAVCRWGGKLAAVGRDLAAAVIDDDEAHQYRISFETAGRYMEEGAVLIDVRDEADYMQRHIAGSICMPLPQLAEQLPVLFPDKDTVLIFYCAKGVRSATAATRAAEMGYARAYTVSGIDDGPWEYVQG